MKLDAYTLVFLRRPPDAPTMSDEELDELQQRHLAFNAGLRESEVIERHSSGLYRVFALGFVAGFAYLGIVDEAIAMPRHATPRVRVPAGSVGIAGVQTGIYPAETPGGWRVIGRTPVKPFDLSRPDPFLMKAGDAVQFYVIHRGEYEVLERESSRR